MDLRATPPEREPSPPPEGSVVDSGSTGAQQPLLSAAKQLSGAAGGTLPRRRGNAPEETMAQPHAGAAQASTRGRGDHGPAGADAAGARSRQDPLPGSRWPEERAHRFALRRTGRAAGFREAGRPHREAPSVTRHQSSASGSASGDILRYSECRRRWSILLLRSFCSDGTVCIGSRRRWVSSMLRARLDPSRGSRRGVLSRRRRTRAERATASRQYGMHPLCPTVVSNHRSRRLSPGIRCRNLKGAKPWRQ